MRIAMIGAGYVGLVSGACFADFGHEVWCVDADPEKVAALRGGRTPIYEPGLNDLIERNVSASRLSFGTDVGAAVGGADVVFIAVGTPSRRGDGHADLSHVFAAAREIACALDGPTVVVTKSTVPVGTGDEVERIIREANPAAEVAVASNPEFLREGSAIEDFKRPDRIVIGTEDEWAGEVMAAVYRPLSLNVSPVFHTGRRTAELIKYAGNAYLAMRITFINEMADLCERVGADVQHVARGMGMDRRIGPKFLHAGPGYGGSCFPKDTVALLKIAQDAGVGSRLVESTVAVNDRRKRAMARKVVDALDGDIRGRRIAVAGLTFKPNTDDMREAPSLHIVQALLDAGAEVVATDPVGMEAARALMPGIAFTRDVYGAARDADALVLVTEWNAYRSLDFDRLSQLMRGRALIDLRNMFDPDEVADAGFHYSGVGRGLPASRVPGPSAPLPNGAIALPSTASGASAREPQQVLDA